MSPVGRFAATCGVALLLTGCGFRPVYAPPGQNAITGDIYVDIIPNRNGQLLRQALQARIDGSDDTPAHALELNVSYAEGAQAVGIQHDNTTTRLVVSGTATWTLRKPGGATIASGTQRSLDGANLIDGQFYYNSLNSEAIDRRVAENLADQIVLQLAAYFRAHPTAGQPGGMAGASDGTKAGG